ncbi:MAG: FtsX-like permease family protein [Saprospiraceae bacterium]|jgi:putative ABC transport system permease protein|uniref:ABC transporter permease n=1 Tax=Candidatus Brachybacter algidus TaxID=2982024 RepID=UPI001B4723A1|nr:FtsX-like permease family protein [Candidatus Brachybacter algidus]MBP7540831.1 ABC transporter permease [Saprospiraceae bacterium]MBK6450165.1 ABC transporter permease [Candidatus Brachybacter algidus]MBK7603255.1 ABC transporter permease [Candidatus Brachybacter algidus]MBK8356654.1 ABC transporter permease [Candidatus Brachybacter algidus]MBK8844207.1 ABC transporter permease [Candidatus Brachybacter algidus]
MIRHIFKLIWFKRKSNALMILEIFLAYLVLFAAFSFVIYQLRILEKPLGFKTIDRWMISLEGLQAKDSAEVATIMDQLKNELKASPNVESVGFTNSSTPFSNNTSTTGNDDMGFNVSSRIAEADEGFGEVMNINIIKGRWFNETDRQSKYRPIVVNELFLKNFFPNKNMLDSVIILDGESKIVGIMDDYRYKGEFDLPTNMSFCYTPHTQGWMYNIILRMKAGTPIGEQKTINDIVKNVTKSNSFIIKLLESEREKNSRAKWIPIIALLSICGFLCINIALGLFGVLWFNINKRRSEIGLRRALGAHSSDISKHFLMETLVLAFIAIALALIFTIQIPLLKVVDIQPSIFYESMVWVTVLILILVFICAYFPSRQAAMIHPATALHED